MNRDIKEGKTMLEISNVASKHGGTFAGIELGKASSIWLKYEFAQENGIENFLGNIASTDIKATFTYQSDIYICKVLI